MPLADQAEFRVPTEARVSSRSLLQRSGRRRSRPFSFAGGAEDDGANRVQAEALDWKRDRALALELGKHCQRFVEEISPSADGDKLAKVKPRVSLHVWLLALGLQR